MPTKKTTKRATATKTTTKKSTKTVADVMTPDPVGLLESETVADAARLMRDNDIGDVLVLDDTGGRPVGIVTDRDLVIRALADGGNAKEMTLSTIVSQDLVCVSPDDSIDDAVELMRAKAIRRVPVVERDQAVGIVSIGDLAQTLDKKSALAEISAAPPQN